MSRTAHDDADGNELTSSNGLAFNYNAKNQTTAITGLFGAPLTMIGYADAGQGERTKTTSGGVDTVSADGAFAVGSVMVRSFSGS